MKKGIPEDKVILIIYGGQKITLNGKASKDYPHKGGGLFGALPLTLTLEPGEYTVTGDYAMTSSAGGKNHKFKGVDITINLRGGYEYDLGVLTDERELQYAVGYVPLDHKGWFVAYRLTENN